MKNVFSTLLLTLSTWVLVISQSTTNTARNLCSIGPDILEETLMCDNNGTPYDFSDDTFTFDVEITSVNTQPGSTGEFEDDLGNTFLYANSPEIVSYGPFPVPNIVIRYEDDVEPDVCLAVLNVTFCDPVECEITPEAPTDILCDDNGTPYDPSDDTFTFNINVMGNNTEGSASNTFNDDQGNSGIAYGTTVSYGPYPISGGAVTVNFSDADAPLDFGCTAMMIAIPPPTCEVECDINPIIIGESLCDDNGTEYDPSDDTFTFTVTVNGSNTAPTASNTFNDDQGNTGVAYGTTVTYGPYPISGGPITVTFSDVDAPADVCMATVVGTQPMTCSPAMCEITPGSVIVSICNDNGTEYDNTDDTFTFTVFVDGDNTASSASNTFNDDQGNLGIAYGTTVTYGPYPISGGPITIVYTDVDAPADVGCTATIVAVPPMPCQIVMCDIDPDTAANILCDDNGTPFDPNDDTYTFTITVNGMNDAPSASNTFNDNQGNAGVAYGTTVSYGPYPISGGPITVNFSDADAPADFSCNGMMTAIPPQTCSDAKCEILPDTPIVSVCDDNGTEYDFSDDTFTFTVTVPGCNTAPGASNTFNDNQGNAGIAYGTTVTYGPYPISGGPVTVNFVDADAPADIGCTAMIEAVPPGSCIVDCGLTPVIVGEPLCDDNGTEYDPSDDTFTFTVTVNGMNDAPSASNTFNDDQGNAGIAYGTTLTYGPYPISGGNPITVTYTDADAPADFGCIAMFTANPPPTCSPAICEIIPESAIVSDCNDNGTPFDPSDDTYTFTVTVGGENTALGASNTFNDDQGNSGIPYGTTITYGPYPMSNASFIITYTDADAPVGVGCTQMISVTAPEPCIISTCDIFSDPAIVSVCNDNGTEYDPSDDTFTFTVTVGGDNTDPSASDTFNDDQGNAGIPYGTTVTYGPFPISGGVVTVTAVDADAPASEMCTEEIMAIPPEPCTVDCDINPVLVGEPQCDDNGTEYDPSDDTFTFTVTVNGMNDAPSASNTFNDDQGNAGVAYGTTITYGPYPISGGPITVNYADADAPSDFGCTAIIAGIPPVTCSPAMCDISPDPAIVSVCNDNGTPYDPTDDTFTFTVLVNGLNTASNASNTFNDDQGNTGVAYGTTVTYGPYPIIGGPITVNFVDVDAPAVVGCIGMITAIPPAPCAVPSCDIIPETAIVSDCNDNGTEYDFTDDTFTFTVTVNGSNTAPGASNTFNDDQGNSGVAYGTTVTYGPYPISGGPVTVTFADADAPADFDCSAIIVAIPPDFCVVDCLINPDPPIVSACDDNGTPFDDSDDTYTFTVTVNGSNTAQSASNTFNDDQGNSGIAYGTTITYGPYLISGGPITVTYFDADAPEDFVCTAMITAIPPDDCSPAMCVIIPDPPIVSDCDDNGTPYDNSDDTFTFTVTVNGSNTAPGASNTFNDDQGNTGVAYGTTITYGPYPMGGGPVVVNFVDADAPEAEDCEVQVVVIPPDPCIIIDCEILPDPAIVSACSDNGTPYDPSDDTYTFTVTVNGSNTALGASNTFNDDQGNSGIAYGTTVTYGPLPISGGPIVVTYIDADAPEDFGCTEMIVAIPPDPCEVMCMVNPDPAIISACDDNGTPFDGSDDSFTFTITVNGSNTAPGASNTFNDNQGNTSIAYGTTVTYGPYPISGGPITVTYSDADAPADFDCTAEIVATPPNSCIAECEILPELGIIICDDNGTEFDETDDTFTFEVTVNGLNTALGASNTFNDDQGNTGITYGTTITYGPFPVSNGPVIVQYMDADGNAPDCIATLSVDDPMCDITVIPTMGEWGLIILALLLIIFSVISIRQRSEEEVFSL